MWFCVLTVSPLSLQLAYCVVQFMEKDATVTEYVRLFYYLSILLIVLYLYLFYSIFEHLAFYFCTTECHLYLLARSTDLGGLISISLTYLCIQKQYSALFQRHMSICMWVRSENEECTDWEIVSSFLCRSSEGCSNTGRKPAHRKRWGLWAWFWVALMDKLVIDAQMS